MNVSKRSIRIVASVLTLTVCANASAQQQPWETRQRSATPARSSSAARSTSATHSGAQQRPGSGSYTRPPAQHRTRTQTQTARPESQQTTQPRRSYDSRVRTAAHSRTASTVDPRQQPRRLDQFSTGQRPQTRQPASQQKQRVPAELPVSEQRSETRAAIPDDLQLDSFDPMQALVKMVMGTVIVLCLLVVILLAAKKWLPKTMTEGKLDELSGGRLHIVSTLALSSRAQLKVVSTGSQLFLVGLDSSGLKSMAPLTSFDEVLEQREIPNLPTVALPAETATNPSDIIAARADLVRGDAA